MVEIPLVVILSNKYNMHNYIEALHVAVAYKWLKMGEMPDIEKWVHFEVAYITVCKCKDTKFSCVLPSERCLDTMG